MIHNHDFSKSYNLADESSTILFGQKCAHVVQSLALMEPGLVIYLRGDLGMGKTCFSRAFVQHFLPGQRVKSPTYTLIESYAADYFSIHHLDLYRLSDPEELEFLGLRDLLDGAYIALIEWPDKAKGFLIPADINIEIRSSATGRILSIEACSEALKRQWIDIYSHL
ncbi:tRNA (adenosine(37)-N6)-threonylcarbamoyltransferase complex ATPase subunit type 1 TsaE [Thiomicrospira microaerophila]|uniref:tRNA (adenosine(37)-N6)-threonylcarbamoyltransferase complex ATPase subunit type 1 TsaE n=1 Tax=Thiomicrospira microaerophila TaxID=406020 RepID=UPI0020102093|nr:tRNA (adenosine(37)-N6)-threonylcarbamoyltransferase complex ATPase subunit type 1 TsaE [Thiomicrospira microaerophila]UQB41667.1 tRNA (adenosine(37)-N6)-threonylcarbamoyltransferase complex ATPase subunit type 1 TsaE [Thiomicrospira microaerophila]